MTGRKQSCVQHSVVCRYPAAKTWYRPMPNGSESLSRIRHSANEIQGDQT